MLNYCNPLTFVVPTFSMSSKWNFGYLWNIFSWIIDRHIRLNIFKLISPFYSMPVPCPVFYISMNSGIISLVISWGLSKLFLSLFSFFTVCPILQLFYKTNLILSLLFKVFCKGSFIAFWMKITFLSKVYNCILISFSIFIWTLFSHYVELFSVSLMCHSSL